ncbi:gas vesicle protein GvpK [Micromonospora sp. NBC_01655]|uniref:gas vesicle protein GvpK n=1 Tax=Micromonospora sp. NBC_01655 TaxID=2975983 RepID=UPI002B1CCC0E|nr:gas vesicle protein GvpK [Micromonospora sp. NBC_01655]
MDRDSVERGLASLVLTVIELLRQLTERQALPPTGPTTRRTDPAATGRPPPRRPVLSAPPGPARTPPARRPGRGPGTAGPVPARPRRARR